ncbi:MAG: hypothetical protein ACI4NN_07570 [Pyramidobacter sp.]
MRKSIDSLIKMAMWVAVVAFTLRCAISYKQIQSGVSLYSLFGYAGEAIGIAAVIMLLYEKWFWKYIPFSKVPNISGNYNGTIKSDFDNKIRQANIVIRQTRLSIDIFFQTSESKSRTVSGTIENIYDENELVYTFINEPKATHRSHSDIHYGTAIFILDSKNKLTGNYFTDRKTTGEMEFTKIKK